METAYNEQWQRFLSNNKDLIDQIDGAIAGLTPYRTLLKHYADSLSKRINDGNRDWDNDLEALGEETEAIGIYAWRELNPLLERAAEQMGLEGIDPKEFFG